MSSQEYPTTGKSKIGDEYGRTRVPKDICDEAGIGKGDNIKWVYQNGELIVVVEE